MTMNINDFLTNGVIEGGARASKFRVELFNLPFSSQQVARVPFLVQAASLPAFQIESATTFYMGRAANFAGDRTFQPWQVEVINTEDFAIRAILEKWQNMCNTLISNGMDPNVFPTGYKCQATVTQMSQDGSDLRAYTFSGLWPMVIDPIVVNWGMQSQIETFGTTFQYDYYEPDNQSSAIDTYSPTLASDGTSGNFSGS
jgi:hypothetical protein